MIYQEGYVYQIKDEYFEKVQDGNLMQNKENGTYRPTFYCLRDEKTSLLWMVPLSSRVQKYKAIHDKQEQKYGRCLTIVLGKFDGKEAAFLLQNMFPVRDYYLDHIHTRNNNPVPVKHIQVNFFYLLVKLILVQRKFVVTKIFFQWRHL